MENVFMTAILMVQILDIQKFLLVVWNSNPMVYILEMLLDSVSFLMILVGIHLQLAKGAINIVTSIL